MLLQRGCTWLTLMPLLLSLSIGELSFYRDALPETSEDIALKRLYARYLEAQRFQRRSLPSTFLSRVHKDHSSLQHTHQKDIEYLANRAILESLLRQKQRAKMLLAHHYRPNQYHDPNAVDQLTEGDLAFLASYNLGLKPHLGFVEEKQPNEYDDGRFTKDLGYGRTFDVDKSVEEEPIVDSFHGNYANRDHAMGMGMDMFVHEGGKEAVFMRPMATTEPEFTYKFDDTNLKEEHPFAVNDPRYYNDMPFSSDDFNRQEETKANWKEEKETKNKEPMLIQDKEDTRSVHQKTSKDLTAEFIVSEPERSAGHHPSIVPVYNNNFNNDVYFIAIVAGCSAAAMFALVLISLTWCRLQRGAKAAADIEYPAYGVTGPNKDVSPSGDQRLAQSAQMYHFQHQKQQIIAMESRTSATRDPGSLSEAESDEENEEGDYTVYECPGLASTGEMEVKNPMFHDDPTPATPATQKDDKEDHI